MKHSNSLATKLYFGNRNKLTGKRTQRFSAPQVIRNYINQNVRAWGTLRPELYKETYVPTDYNARTVNPNKRNNRTPKHMPRGLRVSSYGLDRPTVQGISHWWLRCFILSLNIQ